MLGWQVNADMFLQLGHGGLLFVADVTSQWQFQQLAGAVLHAHSSVSLQHREDVCDTSVDLVLVGRTREMVSKANGMSSHMSDMQSIPLITGSEEQTGVLQHSPVTKNSPMCYSLTDLIIIDGKLL